MKDKNSNKDEEQNLNEKVDETLEEAVEAMEDQHQDEVAEHEMVEVADCAKCPEYLAGWKRAVADYENLKRQTAEDKINFSRYAHEQMLLDILPAIDQFETALNHIPDTAEIPELQKKQIDNWLIGIKAVNSLWEQMFQNIGLVKINTDGEFDPNLHNAVSQESDPDKPKGAILKTIQSGWMLKDTVLRPAKVVVNKINYEEDK
ncbi:MAG: nucleotide exchange factor GrpE [Patescibacteria group bacterium]|nr:nucleotide exchange factor GrpE [Patescibacteria group bacterium]